MGSHVDLGSSSPHSLSDGGSATSITSSLVGATAERAVADAAALRWGAVIPVAATEAARGGRRLSSEVHVEAGAAASEWMPPTWKRRSKSPLLRPSGLLPAAVP